MYSNLLYYFFFLLLLLHISEKTLQSEWKSSSSSAYYYSNICILSSLLFLLFSFMLLSSCVANKLAFVNTYLNLLVIPLFHSSLPMLSPLFFPCDTHIYVLYAIGTVIQLDNLLGESKSQFDALFSRDFTPSFFSPTTSRSLTPAMQARNCYSSISPSSTLPKSHDGEQSKEF